MKYSAVFAGFLLLLLGSCSTMQPRERFIVSPRSTQYPADTVEAQSDALSTDGVQKREVTVSYYPDEDAVCLEYRVNFVTYYQFWSRAGRETFKTALERYKEDYEQRSLNTKGGRKERRVYGTVHGYLWWQVMQRRISIVSETARAPVEVDIGYSFKGRSLSRTPYFTVTQNEAEYDNRELIGRTIKSVRVMLYFTRAQAEELAALFDQEYLLGLTETKAKGSGPADVDEY